MRPILCLDFDGVVHSYASGWKGAAVIPDPPVPGAIAFIREAIEHFRVAIYSSRSNQVGGIAAMQMWLGDHMTAEGLTVREALHIAAQIEWPLEKPPALVTLDDRALTFTGKWPSIASLKAFKPWTHARPRERRLTGAILAMAVNATAQHCRLIQGFTYGMEHVVRNLALEPSSQIVWRETFAPGDERSSHARMMLAIERLQSDIVAERVNVLMGESL